MPVLGNEEMGVKASVGQFSEYSAGIPIKKRRYPFICSHSQSTEDSPSLPTENESEQKGFSSTVSNDSIATVSSNPSDVLASLNPSGFVASSNTSSINADGIAARLNSGSSAASSNASGVAMSSAAIGFAMSSTAISFAASLNAGSSAASLNSGSVAASYNASGVATSSNAISVAASLNACSFAASSNASSVTMSSTAISVAASLNAGSVAASSNAFGVAASSTAISVSTSSNAGSVAVSSNAPGVATSYTAISVATSSNAGSVAASSNASSVATSSTAISVAANSNAGSVVESSNASGVSMSSTAISVAASCNASRAVENSNASSVTKSVAGFSDASEKSVPKKENCSYSDTNGNMVQGNTTLRRVKLDEQSFTVHSRSLADIDSKGKFVATGESDNTLRKSAKSELDLVGNDSFTINIGEDIDSQKNLDTKLRSQWPSVSGNPGLSFGLREYPSAMASGNNGQGFQNQEKTEPVSLNLSLGKGECSTQSRSTDAQPNTNNDGANMLSDRSKWDLNTTMDSWEGPASDDAATKASTHMDDIKPLIVSAGMDATSMHTQRQILQEIEHRAKIEMSSILSSQWYGTEDSLCLGHTTPTLYLNSNEKPSGSSAKVDSCKVVADISSPGESVPVSKPVKSEPLDEGVRNNIAGVKAKPMGSLNIMQVKCELIENCISESSKSSTLSTINSVDARSLEPEPVCESTKETPERMEGSMNQSDEQMLCPVDTTTVPTSTDSSLHDSVSTHVELFIQAKETVPSGQGPVASKMISSAGHDVNESNIPGKMDNCTSQSEKVKDPDCCRLKSMDVQLPDTWGTAEGSVSDEEKINLSGDVLEEDSNGFDYESDDNRELAAAMDTEHDVREEDDFEDGEVREAVENTETEVPMFERPEAGNRNNGDSGDRNSDFVGFVGDSNSSSSSFKEKETQREDPEADKEACLQESSDVEVPSGQIDKKAAPRKSLDVSGNKDTIKGNEGEQTSIQATDTSQGTSVTIAQGADDKITDSEGKSSSVLPKVEAFLNGDDAGKDVDNGGSWSRILNISRPFNLSSAGKTRSISGRTLQSQVGRERLPDVALEGDRFHPRGRVEAYVDGSHRFSRERHLVQSSRNNRISFMRGRCRHTRSFADDHADPVFVGCQPSFEGLDGPFIRGYREFTAVQGRGHAQTCSKSPTRPRSRSPGPWSSLRRRSPNGFGGPLELPHRRSPPIYRMERIRSPDRPCFAGEMVIRHGSPPYLSRPSNDLRDLDPGRDHGRPRSGISSRSPSGRILLKNHRGLDLVDPRERNDGDDYFGGLMPSGRFHELGSDGNAVERRRYSDRRGPVRPFRPPYSGADSENFHRNAEGGPRSFRFCPEDLELCERGNMREREFDGRVKNRPGNAPRRTRNIEEREGNFRPGGQVWHDDGFDGMSQLKRKRL